MEDIKYQIKILVVKYYFKYYIALLNIFFHFENVLKFRVRKYFIDRHSICKLIYRYELNNKLIF